MRVRDLPTENARPAFLLSLSPPSTPSLHLQQWLPSDRSSAPRYATHALHSHTLYCLLKLSLLPPNASRPPALCRFRPPPPPLLLLAFAPSSSSAGLGRPPPLASLRRQGKDPQGDPRRAHPQGDRERTFHSLIFFVDESQPLRVRTGLTVPAPASFPPPRCFSNLALIGWNEPLAGQGYPKGAWKQVVRRVHRRPGLRVRRGFHLPLSPLLVSSWDRERLDSRFWLADCLPLCRTSCSLVVCEVSRYVFSGSLVLFFSRRGLLGPAARDGPTWADILSLFCPPLRA